FDSQYSINSIEWLDDSSAFTFEYNQRGHQVYRVLSVDAASGKVRAIIDETSPTFIDYSGKKFRHDVKDKNEIIWASERDGWNHLYLYDSETGKVKNQITSGDWPVREVLKVDDEKRQIYFTASGMDKNMDPYFLQYCRIDFDGKNFKRYTTENGNHKVTFSPDYTFYTDQYSRVDMPQKSVLKEEKSGKTVMKLQEGDITDLVATGWKMPEVFSAKGRDGKTDIWGVIIRPTNFDSAKTYPIIEYIYAGPHDSFVPKDFQSYYWSMSSLAELGFIVVQIDGMGTSNRSKAFHDICWKNLKDAGFPDRKLWIKAAAKKYPYMDADHVGIHGTSAGGQNAGAALVFNSDFYKVAVASCGCHDNRMDKIWWNEQWMGYPVGPQYAACSNIEHADELEGDILLMVGEVDDNVDPASTMQFADALIKANKNFDLVVLPGMSHTAGGEFGERKRKDFFVEKLLGVKPPSWDKIYKESKTK
ncbi:MAG: prolyl oligopeptidase family serine peptidase, partial [Leeuwenhoekiella sp.]